ncbi:hypothetical protein ABBQ32_000671 [Trebouxia sp. C0010 RCD-2024]
MERPAVQSKLELASQQPLAIEQLATSDLQLLAAAHGNKCAWQQTRAAVLSVVRNEVLQAERLRTGPNTWLVENAKGTAPQQVLAGMVSYNGELFTYRSLPAHQTLPGETAFQPPDQRAYMMKLDKVTHRWEPVSNHGAPIGSLQGRFEVPAGVVHEAKLYVPRMSSLDDGTDILTYDFIQHVWEVRGFGDDAQPHGCYEQLLAVHEYLLIQYARHCVHVGHPDSTEALWTYDTQQCKWQQKHATGLLPEPRRTLGLAVANGCAYLIAGQHITAWDRSLQGRWVWHETYHNYTTTTGETSSLWFFDFDTLRWSREALTGDCFQPRHFGLLAQHDGALVCMAGLTEDPDMPQAPDTPALSVQTIRRCLRPRSSTDSNTSFKRHNLTAKHKFKNEVMTDATITVGDASWKVHRADLALESPILRQALEIQPEQGLGCVLNISDVDEGTMGLLLEWVYGGLEAAPSLPETKALFEAAHKYEMLDLQYQCEQAMAEQVDIYVYPELMELATIHYASVLEQGCKRFHDSLDAEGLQALNRHMDMLSQAQALDPSASIEVVGAPGEGSLPGQGYSEKGNEAEKCNLVVDSTLRVLDAPSMQPDKAPWHSAPISDVDTLSTVDRSGLTTDQDSSEKAHEEEERITVVDAALSMLDTPSRQTDKAVQTSERLASLERMESSKAVDCNGFVPDQHQCAKHDAAEEREFVADLALTMVEITTPGAQADEDSYDGVPRQLLNRDHEQVASNEGEPNSPMGVQDNGMIGAAGGVPDGAEHPSLQALKNAQTSQQASGEISSVQAPTDVQQEGGGKMPSLQSPRGTQPDEEVETRVLQPEALPKCSCDHLQRQTAGNWHQHCGNCQEANLLPQAVVMGVTPIPCTPAVAVQEAGKVSQRPPSEIPQQVEQFVAGCRHAGVSLHLAPCQSLAVSMQEGRYWGLAMPSCASSRHQAICCTPLAETFSPDGVALHSQKCNGKIKTVHDRLLCEAPKTYSKT